MALIPDPELLILDEPTQGMDVEGRRGFWTAIREDAARGRTIIFATHYLEEADAYAGRIVLIAKGQIVADGTAAQVKGLASGRIIRATWPGARTEHGGSSSSATGRSFFFWIASMAWGSRRSPQSGDVAVSS